MRINIKIHRYVMGFLNNRAPQKMFSGKKEYRREKL